MSKHTSTRKISKYSKNRTHANNEYDKYDDYDKYDFIIAGGGIAGLYTAYKLHLSHPDAQILLLEKTERLGGRLKTIYDKTNNTLWEAGGARFNDKHTNIKLLISELNLNKNIKPISSDIKIINTSNTTDSDKFHKLQQKFPKIDSIIKFIKNLNLPSNIMTKTTINSLYKKYIATKYNFKSTDKYLLDIYPYYSELAVLNAFDSIELFEKDFLSDIQYYVLSTGMSSIVDNIIERLPKNKVKIIKNAELIDIKTNNKSSTISSNTSIVEYKLSDDNKVINAVSNNAVILALTKEALLQIPLLQKHKLITKHLNSISPQPLYRIYAKLEKPVLPELFASKICTNTHLKYIIPYDMKNGIIMISYTDGIYAKYMLNKYTEFPSHTEFWDNVILPELVEIFGSNNSNKPTKSQILALKPEWIKHYYWANGAGYWLPRTNSTDIYNTIYDLSNYDSRSATKLSNIYICGENYSRHQAWVEGALDTSNKVLEAISIHKIRGGGASVKNRTKKSTHKSAGKAARKYTMDEIAKHNKKSDAWIVIHNNVYNITNWIPKHPGGDIILKGVGRNATKLFEEIGHSPYARSKLSGYKIGVIQ